MSNFGELNSEQLSSAKTVAFQLIRKLQTVDATMANGLSSCEIYTTVCTRDLILRASDTPMSFLVET